MSGMINAKNLEMLLLMALDSVPAQLVPETDSQISKWERPILDFYVTREKSFCTGTTDIYKGYVMRSHFQSLQGFAILW